MIIIHILILFKLIGIRFYKIDYIYKPYEMHFRNLKFQFSAKTCCYGNSYNVTLNFTMDQI